MGKVISRLTVLFDEPFWVGLLEKETDGKYEVCKITFGSEPTNYQLYEFMLKHWYDFKFSPAIDTEIQADRHINPKRMQREVNRQIKNIEIGTKAQEALKLQHEQSAQVHRKSAKQKRAEESKRKFNLHQQKRKEKHKGH